MQDGTAIEVATIGNEGLAGYTAVGGGKISANKVIVQINDGGLRIDARAPREEVAQERAAPGTAASATTPPS